MLRLNPATLSRALGQQFLDRGAHLRVHFETTLLPLIGKRLLDKTLQRSNSGSISAGSALTLFLMAQAKSPQIIVEVGTYIGNSAASIAFGSGLNGTSVEVFSCDINHCCQNPLDGLTLPKGSYAEIFNTSSTEMFVALAKKQRKIDFLHLDGRLQEKDIKMLELLMKEDTIIALDDCVSNEKGHANLGILQASGIVKNYLFIEPFSKDIFRLWGLESYSTTGILVPMSFVQFTRQ